MTKRKRLAAVASILFACAAVVRADAGDALSLVDPTVGTATASGAGGGALYPGAALPYAMVKLSPDTTKPSTAGYNPAEPILGFSHTHIGGTGGAAFGGQIRLRPQAGPLDVAAPASPKEHEAASPGYYAVDLKDGHVRVELTSTERAGFHRYAFPAGTPARVLIDVSAALNNGSVEKPPGICTGSSARFVSDREVEGQGSFKAGFGGMIYTVYFVAIFEQPATARGAWLDKAAKPNELAMTGAEKQPAGLYAEFPSGATVDVRVGISYTSVELARKNLEPAAGMTFDQVRARSEGIWREHLAKIAIEGGTDAQRRQFYTALYHSVLAPSDATGDNGGWTNDDKQPIYWDLYTIWDTFRSADPLRVLIDPERERGVIRSLLADYQKTGWLPDAWVYNKMGIGFQGGTDADNVIADAVVKKLGGFDADLAYAAISKNATQPQPPGSKTFSFGGRVEPYFTLGYVPSVVYKAPSSSATAATTAPAKNEWGSAVSRTLEYAYNDFCVSEVAAALGKADDAAKFRARSLNCYNLFDPAKKLFWGKDEHGTFSPDPADGTKVTMGWNNMFYEGSAWQYRFSVPHDVAGLIARLGGDAALVATLDEFFDRKLDFVGNEPGFLTPWLYDYAGRPDKTADRVRAILAKDFKLKPSGYPGDEDVGAMSAYYVFASIGIMPNAGQDVYLIGSPLFTRSTMKLGQTGKALVINAAGVSDENRYVQSATLNGKPWDQAWFRHADIVDGAELTLVMGRKPSAWGAANRPPSPAHPD